MDRLRREWIEADGLGGFASGTMDGIRTRRYHALLVTARTPPTGRFVLVNGHEAWLETPSGRFPITSQLYQGSASDVVHPPRTEYETSFMVEPWPRWRIEPRGGPALEHEILVRAGASVTCLSWLLVNPVKEPTTLCVRLLFSGRDLHSLHHENDDFRFVPEQRDGRWIFRPYAGVPSITVLANGDYTHEPSWYRGFLYEEERARGLDHVEDLGSPGVHRFELSRGEAVVLLGGGDAGGEALEGRSASEIAGAMRAAERDRRARFPSPLHRAGDAYLVHRGRGRTIVAGYPWFTDWGRDTFIALRGLCLATGRLQEARAILLEWAGSVDRGMLPNRFPENDAPPEYNAVDASLWFVIAVYELERACEAARTPLPVAEADRLHAAVRAILDGYSRGTRYGIRMDRDGLLAAGEPGVQLTWMDVKIGDWVVTPRIGKPVEVQALWINALAIGARLEARWHLASERAWSAFAERFWNEATGCLYDVVDVDHVAGKMDASVRPNQILAVGGLPIPILPGERAARVVALVEEQLWTPAGLRSLAPGSPGYAPRYEGDPRARDAAYHQGTVWPWLTGAFVEAWIHVHGDSEEHRREARRRFLTPLLAHLDELGLGHLPEIADSEPPHAPRGAPFQAWSVGEALRLQEIVLA